MRSFEARFTAALKDIRKSGVIARRNVASCCRSCYDPKIAENQAIIWHFGGQGNALTIEENVVAYRVRETYRGYSHYTTGNRVDKIWLNHSNLVDDDGELTHAGQAVVNTFRAFDIVLDWDQSEGRCIAIDVKASIPDVYAVQAA